MKGIKSNLLRGAGVLEEREGKTDLQELFEVLGLGECRRESSKVNLKAFWCRGNCQEELKVCSCCKCPEGLRVDCC